MKNNKQLTKSACFTDIHFGRRQSSEQHNKDCLRFVDWFCDNVRSDKSIDHICFLGDFFESRSHISVSTLDYAHRAIKQLNGLGLPIFFIIGNHDLFHRHTREVYSTIIFSEFSNFTVINEPTIVPNVGSGAFFSPYLFEHEYPALEKYLKYKTWWGHFEFKGFVVTGHSRVLEAGPDITDFQGPDRIFSGHFHKRQKSKNTCYIGNTFPMDFNDADDNNRGMMVYDHNANSAEFINWTDCPKFVQTKLSQVLDDTVTLPKDARVKVLVDLDISFEESSAIKQKYLGTGLLREFLLEENQNIIDDILMNTEVQHIDHLKDVDNLVIDLLSNIKTDEFDTTELVKIYKGLKC